MILTRRLMVSAVFALAAMAAVNAPARADAYLGLGGGSGPKLEFRFGSENKRIERDNGRRIERQRRERPRYERQRSERDFFQDNRRKREFGNGRRERGRDRLR